MDSNFNKVVKRVYKPPVPAFQSSQGFLRETNRIVGKKFKMVRSMPWKKFTRKLSSLLYTMQEK